MEAKNSIRVHFPVSENEEMFRELLELLCERKPMVSQITLFMALSHSPMPLETAARQADILEKRMETARSYGFESGINILTTIGHHEENQDNALRGDYTPMTNLDGQVCRGSLCPNDENTRGYVGELYRLIVKANPDYIWIDDDVRFEHWPIGYGCFCDGCLALFREEFGQSFTRETLKEAFEDAKSKKNHNLALKWIQHNRNTLSKLFSHIEKTVNETSAKTIPLGFMTGERFYEGYSFEETSEILRGKSGRQVYWRPGNGAYTDEPLYGLIQKSHEIGRQVSLLTHFVETIQSEIENFPYQMLKKSPAATALETASHIAAGCTGAAYNILAMTLPGETPTDYLPLLDRLAKTQPFYDLLVKTFGRTPPQGVYTGWTKDLYAVQADPGYFAKELLETGLPAAYSPESACVTALSGDSVRVMPTDLIRRLLSKGVYMDARALYNLNHMGYSGLTGFEVTDFLEKDCIEVFSGHFLNEGIPNAARRNCFQEFNKGDAAVIESADSNAQVLSYMVDYSGNVKSECSWGVYENSLGGRICVAGYYPWTFIQSRPKARQLRNIFRWLSRDELLLVNCSYCRLHSWVRRVSNGQIAAAIINGSLETLEDTVFLLKTDSTHCFVYDMGCNQQECRFLPEQSGGGYNAFAIPQILPWQMALVITENQCRK
ncbi:MAG: hypothetical protein LBQ48_00465 [Oscillospiraceae bacterium]|jgi:hypothetical protein|nr:hypothetical protein [Oscillospiraceae bacterium]